MLSYMYGKSINNKNDKFILFYFNFILFYFILFLFTSSIFSLYFGLKTNMTSHFLFLSLSLSFSLSLLYLPFYCIYFTLLYFTLFHFIYFYFSFYFNNLLVLTWCKNLQKCIRWGSNPRISR